MRLKRIAPWLLPTLLAPSLGACLYIYLVSRGSSLPTLAWIAAGAIAAGFSFVVGGLMALTDVALLKAKVRTPPTGWRVWLMGIAAPIPVFWCWQKLVRYAITGWPQLLITFFAPMLVTALVMRVALGTRPASWK